MKRFAVLLFVTVLAFASVSDAKSSKSEGAKLVYTDAQIDINLEKLPPGYKGNNPELIYLSLLKRNLNSGKNEFENTEQFNSRLEKEKAIPILGKIGLRDFFSLQATNPAIKYSADNAEFNIVIKLEKIPEPHWYSLEKIKNSKFKSIKFNEDSKAIQLNLSNAGKRNFLGMNSYGSTTKVSADDYKNYYLGFDNFKEFNFIETFDKLSLWQTIKNEELLKRIPEKYRNNYTPYVSQTDKNWYMDIKLKISAEKARDIKDKIRIVLIATIDNFDPIEKFYYRNATIDRPTEFTSINRYIFFNLKEIWVYNQTTGEIYSKIKKKNVSL